MLVLEASLLQQQQKNDLKQDFFEEAIAKNK